MTSSRSRTRRRLAVLLAVVVVFAVACGSSGAPDAYDEQPVEFESVTGDTEEVPLTEANYRQACEAANPGGFDDDSRLADYCRCTYDKYVELVPFDVFIAFNDEIADNADEITSGQALQRAYRNAVDKVENDTGEPVDTEPNVLEIIAIPCT